MRSMLPALAVSMLLISGPLSAQRPSDTPRSGQDRARLEERIRAHMGEIIQRRLGLDDGEAARLSEIARDFEGRRRALSREERQARERAEDLLEDGRPDDAAAAELLDHFVALRMREAELVREEQARLSEILTPGQILQLYELRVEIGRRIRALRSGDDGRRDGRRGGNEARRSDGRPPGGNGGEA